MNEKLWTNKAADQFAAIVSMTAAFCGHDGRIALTNGSAHQVPAMLSEAARLAGLEKSQLSRRYFQHLAEAEQSQQQVDSPSHRKKERPVTQSDWAQVACMRSNWSTSATTLVVTHHEQHPRLDLSINGEVIMTGPWSMEISIDGQKLDLEDDWECVCWQSDADADYLELQMQVEGCQIDRQLLLSRKDDFLLLADCLSGIDVTRIDYTSRLPLTSSVDAIPDLDSRECVLRSEKKIARVFPLGLPEDRIASTPGKLEEVEQQLTLSQVSAGDGLYAPLILDWSKARKRSEAEWRTLTVTEDGQIVGRGVAASHRLRIGKHHLLLYRSLREPEIPRAFLGQHSTYETFVGKFRKSGEVDPILMVES